MRKFYTGLGALFLCGAIVTGSFVPSAEADNYQGRVLSDPIWMPSDVLLDNENLPQAVSDTMFPMDKMGFTEQVGTLQKFTNNVDGYSIMIPLNMKVDMSLSDVCVTLSDSHRQIRIFKETFSTSAERYSYLEYSNRFALNTTDHKIELDQSYTLGDKTYHVLQWSRKALSNIPNDKCFYACVDVTSGARVYTFFFTSDMAFSASGGYMDIVNSLVTFDPSVPMANAYNKGYQKSSTAHFNEVARTTYDALLSDDAEFKMGMFPPDRYGGFARMEEFEKILDYKFPIFLHYTEVPDKNGKAAMKYTTGINSYITKIEENFKYARKTQRAIELTLQTPLSPSGSGNMIYEILDGKHNQFITQYAKMVARNSDVAVFFRPFNEMNCDWCNYSAFQLSRDPQVYVALYRFLYQKFKEAGCKNVIWVFNPNEVSFPKYKWNSESLYYPGDEYVDVYGITGYNTGTYYDAEIWRSFDEVYKPIYDRAERINKKPIMITEYSCSSMGGDKVSWIEEMFESLKKYDKIKLGIWWHAADYDGENIARPYFMDTPDGTLEVFKNNLPR